MHSFVAFFRKMFISLGVMKRRILIAFYALLPVAGIAYHYGPGQRGMALDAVQACMKLADLEGKAENFGKAAELLTTALAATPADEKDLAGKLEVLKAEARMMNGEVPEAIQDLEAALTKAQKDGAAKETLDKLRAQKSTAHYYAAWLVRLENVSEDEWENQCDLARQGFRFLAENAQEAGTAAEAKEHQKSLESAIRLAQMDQADLKALPLPKCCSS
jgi:hypothetical protein